MRVDVDDTGVGLPADFDPAEDGTDVLVYHARDYKDITGDPLYDEHLAAKARWAEGDTHFIMVATTIGMWVVRVPIAVIAGVWLHLEVFYVWLAMIADWTLRMGLMLWRYRSERWRTIQVIR